MRHYDPERNTDISFHEKFRIRDLQGLQDWEGWRGAFRKCSIAFLSSSHQSITLTPADFQLNIECGPAPQRFRLLWNQSPDNRVLILLAHI